MLGMFTSTGPTYLAELSPREIRGRVISLQQWSISWGVSVNCLPLAHIDRRPFLQ